MLNTMIDVRARLVGGVLVTRDRGFDVGAKDVYLVAA